MFSRLVLRQGRRFLTQRVIGRTFSSKKWYTKSHEWLEMNQENLVTMGISDHAQKALGDIAFVELPEVGETKDEGETVVVVESTKSAGEIEMPIEGEIQEVNQELGSNPELINSSPEGDAWMIKFTFSPSNEESLLDKLMSQGEYHQMLEDETFVV